MRSTSIDTGNHHFYTDIPAFVWMVVGVGLAAALVYFILTKAGAPGWVWTVAMIVGAIILLMVVLNVFF